MTPHSKYIEIREEFYQTQCEKADDSERFSVYENDAEQIADWWIEKLEVSHQDLKDRLMEKMPREKENFDIAFEITNAKIDGFNSCLKEVKEAIKIL